MGLLLKCELRGGSAFGNKSLKVSLSLFSDYFHDPCTTAAAKKNWHAKFLYANLTHDFRFFLYVVLKEILSNIIFLEKNKKLQT